MTSGVDTELLLIEIAMRNKFSEMDILLESSVHDGDKCVTIYLDYLPKRYINKIRKNENYAFKFLEYLGGYLNSIHPNYEYDKIFYKCKRYTPIQESLFTYYENKK